MGLLLSSKEPYLAIMYAPVLSFESDYHKGARISSELKGPDQP